MVRSLRRLRGLFVFVVVGSVCSLVCRVVGLAGCLCWWWSVRPGRGVDSVVCRVVGLRWCVLSGIVKPIACARALYVA